MSEDWSTIAVKLMTEAVDVLCFIMIQGLQIYFVFSVSYSKKFAIACLLPHPTVTPCATSFCLKRQFRES